MKNPNHQLTRPQMQAEALTIQSLLEAALAIQSGTEPEDAVPVIELAYERASQLNSALDIVNDRKEASEGATDG